jgi:hyperosmotically inducible protein
VVGAGAFYLFGYWSNDRFDAASAPETPRIDTGAARKAGAELGEKTAVAASRINESLEEGSLTAKIKAKMVLDDQVKALQINVTTDGTTVTLAGTVHTAQERERALALARETNGVTKVVDQLVIR